MFSGIARLVAVLSCVAVESALHADASTLQSEPVQQRRLLVLVRGESYRFIGHQRANGERNSHEEQNCSEAAVAAQQEATKTHAALFEGLGRAFDLTLSLHTYPVGDCASGLQALYSEAAGGAPATIRYYDKERDNQTTVWRQAWSDIWPAAKESYVSGRPEAPFDALLSLRFDSALWEPARLAAQLISTPLVSNALHVAFPWLGPLVAPSMQQLSSQLDQELTLIVCQGAARIEAQQGAAGGAARSDGRSQRPIRPFVNDALQFVPQMSAGLAVRMQLTFPEHTSVDCLGEPYSEPGHSGSVSLPALELHYLSATPAFSDSSFCRNPVYYLTGRAIITKPCESEVDARALERCCEGHAHGMHHRQGSDAWRAELRRQLVRPYSCEEHEPV